MQISHVLTNGKPSQVANFSRKSIDIHERVLLHRSNQELHRRINSVANSSHCRNSSKALRATRSRLAWNENRRLQLRVWKGCRPLSSSLKILLPWGFPLGAPAGITGAVIARSNSLTWRFQQAALFRADTRVSCVYYVRTYPGTA